jgi:CheY-like chemotaxis protein
MIMEARLAKWGYDYTLKKNADEALHCLETNKPDLIITDYDTRSVSNGLHIIDAGKKLGIPVIMHSNSNVKNEAFAAGAKAFLKKECDREIFQKKVHEVISNSELAVSGGRTR